MEIYEAMKPCILLFATMDTKGPEVLYLRERLK